VSAPAPPRDHATQRERKRISTSSRSLRPAVCSFIPFHASQQSVNSPQRVRDRGRDSRASTASSLASGLSFASFDLGSWVSSSFPHLLHPCWDFVGSSWVLRRPAAASSSCFELVCLARFAAGEVGFLSNSALFPSNLGVFLRIRGGVR
jgi:hypothetical protein